MSLPGPSVYTVDAFTDRPFAGNPAAVVLLDAPLSPGRMQDMAAELRHSETAFLTPREAPMDWGLRWFTPGTEVDLCGHATLAAAHVLYRERGLDPGAELRFHTRSGLLRAGTEADRLAIDLPSAEVLPAELPAGALGDLGVGPRFTGRAGAYFLLELDHADAVQACRPDFAALATRGTHGYIITAPSDDATFAFVSRFFAPALAVDEDPVTGSAHCALGTYWGEKLRLRRMRAYQASERGGVVDVEWLGERMKLRGHAVTVWEGHWRLPAERP